VNNEREMTQFERLDESIDVFYVIEESVIDIRLSRFTKPD